MYKPDAIDSSYGDLTWPGAYHQLWRLHRYWKGAMLVEAASQGQLQSGSIEAMS